jgi:REP element-mobilizing transposase RayT
MFSGVEILTHAIMANHFHLLVRVPDRARFMEQFDGPGGEEKLLERLGLLYSAEHMEALRTELADLRKRQMPAEAEMLLQRFRRRLCNLPLFVKELKERFSKWFNKTHERAGTLWMARFKSVLVEDGEALRTMACYIDLNPVRAGLVEDPKDYRWCGYAEAVAGSERARRGLCMVTGELESAWDKDSGDDGKGPRTPAALYRSWLFERGIETDSRRGVSEESRDAVRKRAGGLSRGELLRCRVRYFTDGVAIGGKEFVDAVFRERRGAFGEKRRNGARTLKEAPGLALFSLRALRVSAVE